MPSPIGQAAAMSDTATTRPGSPASADGAAQQESWRQLQELQQALDHAAIVAATDIRGKITLANSKFCEISGYELDELLGQDHRILNSGYHGKEFFRELWATIAAGAVWRGEIRNRRRDGSLYWVDTTIVPLLDADGQPRRYLSIRTDITARKEAEARLREQTALARLGEMATVVAHEVKNPLAGIGGALQVVRRRLPAGTAEHAVIGDILDRITALNATMEDLLEYARPRPPRRDVVHLAALIDAVVTRCRADPCLQGVTLRGSTQACSVLGDAAMLEGVVLNLLINAGQALGGRGAVEVDTVCDGGEVRVSVRDNGPGIPPALQDRVFEPFFTTRHRGTGLGLAIVRRVVEAHQGKVELRSIQGEGTEVVVRLPAARPTAASEGARSSAAPAEISPT